MTVTYTGVDDDGREWRIDQALVGWFWIAAHNGQLAATGWRPTRKGAERKARAARDRLPTSDTAPTLGAGAASPA